MTYVRDLWEQAAYQHGVVTLDDAREVGVPDVEVRKMAARGVLTGYGSGVYVHRDVPQTKKTEFMVAAALGGDGAFLCGESVFVFHGLGNFNPRYVRVGTRRRVRRSLPPWIDLQRRMDVDEKDIIEVDGIRMMSLDRALGDVQPLMDRERFEILKGECLSKNVRLDFNSQGNEFEYLLFGLADEIHEQSYISDSILDAADDVLCEREGEIIHCGTLFEESLAKSLENFQRKNDSFFPRELPYLAIKLNTLSKDVCEIECLELDSDLEYAAAAVISRAASIYSDILLLSRFGRVSSARSRWRALFELCIVSQILRCGGREIAQRYREHRWVMLERLLKGRHNLNDFSTTDTQFKIEEMAGRVREKYGKSFSGDFGWASAVSTSQGKTKHPSWRDLTEIAMQCNPEVDAIMIDHVKRSNFSIHGSNAAGVLDFVDSEENPIYPFDQKFDFKEVVYLSTRVIRLTVDTILKWRLDHFFSSRAELFAAIWECHALQRESIFMGVIN